MTVDTYAHCPCGSGKKIKFCKCKDSVGELDRVLKMVEGGQIVPALDRLAKILTEHPDAAWALAIRGRLLLDLREYDSLAENAERFIRLQPSNPLALTQRAAAELFRGKLKQANESLLEALTESGRDVDPYVLDISSVLAFMLAQSGEFLTARVYASLALMAQGYEGGQTAMQVLQQLNASASVSQLLKSVPEPLARPLDVEWGERYDEAAGLLRSNKVVLAQSKFESLRRTYPQAPAILSGLLTCAVWRGNAEAQSELMLKLSACESLDFEQRVHYRAMSPLCQPEMPDLSVDVLQLDVDIENGADTQLKLTAESRFVALPENMLAQMKTSEEDVPPRAGFQILDREKPDLDSLPPVDQIPEALAMVLVYGRQTDRSARLEVHDLRRRDADQVRSLLMAALGELPFTESDGAPLPLLVAAQPPIAMVRFKAQPGEAEVMQQQLTLARMPQAIVNLPLKILGGQSLLQTADDDSKLLERTVVVRIVEQYDAIASHGEAVLAEVEKLAKVQPRPTLKLRNDQVETVDNEDLNRVDPSDLDAENLVYLLQRAQQVSATPAMRKIAQRLLEIELPADQLPARLIAYMALLRTAPGNAAALELLEQAKQFADANKINAPHLLLSEVGMRLAAGDATGFQRVLQTITTRHGKDPEVMAQLQQLLIQYGVIRPDGTPRRAATGQVAAGIPQAAPSGSALWTPESGNPPASGESTGGSKLWVPGMD